MDRVCVPMEKIGVASGSPEIVVVKGGPKRAYIWVGSDEDGCYSTVSGAENLRRIADAIYAELRQKN